MSSTSATTNNCTVNLESVSKQDLEGSQSLWPQVETAGSPLQPPYHIAPIGSWQQRTISLQQARIARNCLFAARDDIDSSSPAAESLRRSLSVLPRAASSHRAPRHFAHGECWDCIRPLYLDPPAHCHRECTLIQCRDPRRSR